MSEITNIVKAGKDKYSIYLDNSFSCFLNSETIVKNSLKIGTEIEIPDLETLQAENEKYIALDKALKFLSSIKSEKQVKDYLYSKGYTSKTVQFVINKLKEYNYLNDENFAKIYIQNYKEKKGFRLIRFELESKGIKKEIIDSLLNDVEENTETIYAVAQKYIINKPKDKKLAQKLTNHLFSKGFNYDKINEVVRKLFYNFNDEED